MAKAGGNETGTCSSCGISFQYDVRPGQPPLHCCGQLVCRALQTYTDEQWESAARMAEARQVAGEPLSTLDEHALGKVF